MRANGIKTTVISLRGGLAHYHRGLVRIVTEYSIEMAHIEFFDYFAPVGWLARLAGIRQILFTDYTSGNWEPSSWKSQLVRLRARLASWPVTRFIAISDFIQDRLTRVGVPPRKISRVYLGTDTDLYSPDPGAREMLSEQIGLRDDDLIVLSAMRLLPWKHPEVCLAACALLVKRRIPIRWLIAGDGPLRAKLESLADRLGIAGHVLCLGHYAQPNLLMQASD